MFSLTDSPIALDRCKCALIHSQCGAYVSFEGWVRDHNAGLMVSHLVYEAYHALALKEGNSILSEAKKKFEIESASCIHRLGDLKVGEIAVWVGVSAPHREAAFKACQYIIDRVKLSVPIWKKEYYVDNSHQWINCEHCKHHEVIS